MSIDLILQPVCDHCRLASELYGSTCKHMTFCKSCGKFMAEYCGSCYLCGTPITRLIREYNLRLCSSPAKKYFIGTFEDEVPKFEEGIWSMNREGLQGRHVTDALQEITTRIERASKDHFSAQKALMLSSSAPPLSPDWIPPKRGTLAVNSDAAFKDGDAASAFIICNHQGSILFAASSLHVCLNATVAEALALKEACSYLNLLKIADATFECDCLNVVMALNNWETVLDWSIAGIVEEIKVFSDCWPPWRFFFTVRNANCAVHNLVTWAFSLKWTERFSPSNIPITVFCDGVILL